MGKSVAVMTVMFSVVSFTGEIFSECASALLMTRNFMLTLVPVFTGVIAMSGIGDNEAFNRGNLLLSNSSGLMNCVPVRASKPAKKTPAFKPA